MEQKVKSKGAKKGFYEIEVPMTALRISLYGTAPEDFDGRVITLDMTRNLRGKNLELKMKIRNENGKLKAFPVSANLVGSYVRRAMRRGTDYVEDSFQAACNGGSFLVKPFFITRKRVSRLVRKALREHARAYLIEHLKVRPIQELFSDVITGKLQKGLALKLKKIYPLAMCEIRIFTLIESSPRAFDVVESTSSETLSETVSDADEDKKFSSRKKKKDSSETSVKEQ